MMRAQDFLDLAVRLSAGGAEAEYRTAVGRSYYGAFHLAKELLADSGVRLPDTAEAHRKLQLCLDESGEAVAQDAGRLLEGMRRRRNLADYDLRSDKPGSKGFVDSQLQDAKDVGTAVAACRAEPSWSQFRANVRTYAAQVLRLPLSS
jgi:uncharacterized protein (UPF0332 family)